MFRQILSSSAAALSVATKTSEGLRTKKIRASLSMRLVRIVFRAHVPETSMHASWRRGKGVWRSNRLLRGGIQRWHDSLHVRRMIYTYYLA